MNQPHVFGFLSHLVPLSTESSALCYTAGSHWLYLTRSINSVSVSIPISQFIPPPCSFSIWTGRGYIRTLHVELPDPQGAFPTKVTFVLGPLSHHPQSLLPCSSTAGQQTTHVPAAGPDVAVGREAALLVTWPHSPLE